MLLFICLLVGSVAAYHIRFFRGSFIGKSVYQPFLDELCKHIEVNSIKFQPYISFPEYPPNTLLIGHSFGGTFALLHSQWTVQNNHSIILINSHFNVNNQMPYFDIPFDAISVKAHVFYCKEDMQLPSWAVKEDEKAAREKKDPLYFKEYEGDHFSIFQNRDLLNTCVRDIALFLKEGGP